jgi:lipopolysaccharide export system protein LptC
MPGEFPLAAAYFQGIKRTGNLMPPNPPKQSGHDFMGPMSARPMVTAADIQAYARKVRLLKLLVPVAGVCLLLLIIVWPYVRDYESGFTLSFQDLSKSSEKIRLTDPRYVGLDNEHRRFEITAKSALQDQGGTGEVNLDKIRASVLLKDNTEVVLTAAAGMYSPQQALLKLVDGIRIASGSGYEVTLDHAQYNVDAAIASSDDRVQGKAPFGAFTANSFTADIEGRSFRLKGEVHVRVEPGKRQNSGAPKPRDNKGGTGGR